jgi:hypothetical protein
VQNASVVLSHGTEAGALAAEPDAAGVDGAGGGAAHGTEAGALAAEPDAVGVADTCGKQADIDRLKLNRRHNRGSPARIAPLSARI